MAAANCERISAPVSYVYYRIFGSSDVKTSRRSGTGWKPVVRRPAPKGLYCTVQIPGLSHKTRFNLTDFFTEKFDEAGRSIPFSNSPARLADWERSQRGQLSSLRVEALVVTAPTELTVMQHGDDYEPDDAELEAWFRRMASLLRLSPTKWLHWQRYIHKDGSWK